jgi:hypothetical protein
MKILTLLIMVCSAFSGGGHPELREQTLIDRLDEAIQRRFAAPPQLLGMSRAVEPSSFGRHFQPAPGAVTDFRPETPEEQALMRDLQAANIRAGIYVFGAAILRAAPEARDFRALKGPGVITPGTVRPAWYPPQMSYPYAAGALAGWNEVYPIARQAMAKFAIGLKTHEASAGDWRVVARAIPASAPSCIGCHNNPLIGRSSSPIALNDAIGGVLYVYRTQSSRDPAPRAQARTVPEPLFP